MCESDLTILPINIVLPSRCGLPDAQTWLRVPQTLLPRKGCHYIIVCPPGHNTVHGRFRKRVVLILLTESYSISRSYVWVICSEYSIYVLREANVVCSKLHQLRD